MFNLPGLPYLCLIGRCVCHQGNCHIIHTLEYPLEIFREHLVNISHFCIIFLYFLRFVFEHGNHSNYVFDESALAYISSAILREFGVLANVSSGVL